MYPTLVHEWFEEVWNRGDENAARRLLAPDGVIYNLDQEGHDYRGPEEFLTFFKRYREAFPDMHIAVEDAITAGDTAAGRWSVKATHRGDSLGFEATHRPVSIQGMCFVKFRNGQIVEAWSVFDMAAMMNQLGFALKQQSQAGG